MPFAFVHLQFPSGIEMHAAKVGRGGSLSGFPIWDPCSLASSLLGDLTLVTARFRVVILSVSCQHETNRILSVV